MVRTDRGREIGTVLCLKTFQDVSEGVQLKPGQILSSDEQQSLTEQERLNQLGHEVLSTANQLVKELFLPIKFIDMETVSDPDSVILHLLMFGRIDLKPLQAALEERCRTQIILHDVTNPEALEEAATEDCSSCGEGGRCATGSCGSGGCGEGSCGSGGSTQAFQDNWRNYFAALRQGMERHHE